MFKDTINEDEGQRAKDKWLKIFTPGSEDLGRPASRQASGQMAENLYTRK